MYVRVCVSVAQQKWHDIVVFFIRVIKSKRYGNKTIYRRPNGYRRKLGDPSSNPERYSLYFT